MSEHAIDLASGKGHKDENFPVASWLVRADARAPIMAFYRFARAADDIADHPTATAHDKLAQLAAMRAGLISAGINLTPYPPILSLSKDRPSASRTVKKKNDPSTSSGWTGLGGESLLPTVAGLSGDGAPVAMALAATARARGLDLVPAQELLDAFVHDVTVQRTADWAALMAYCRMSAMPVGRFVLDVHGEDRALWPLSDALCAALQIVNHLQDCSKDYRAIGRVYVPEDMMAAAGVPVNALDAARSTPALRAVITDCATRTLALLRESAPFATAIKDTRLAAEVAIIQRLAVDLAEGLTRRDPLSENVQHAKPRAAWLALGAVLQLGVRRLRA